MSKQTITAPGDDGEPVVIATVEMTEQTYTDDLGRQQTEQVANMVIYNVNKPSD